MLVGVSLWASLCCELPTFRGSVLTDLVPAVETLTDIEPGKDNPFYEKVQKFGIDIELENDWMVVWTLKSVVKYYSLLLVA